MALGGAAMTLGTALAGSVLAGAGDGRGAVEPQAPPSSAATSATAASFPCEVDAGPRARTSGPHAMPFSLGEVSQGARGEIEARTASLLPLSVGRPGPHHLAEDRELAEMVGIVVADEAQLAQERVSGGARDHRQQVRGRIGHEIVQRRPVGTEPLDRARELLRRGGGVSGVAVASWAGQYSSGQVGARYARSRM